MSEQPTRAPDDLDARSITGAYRVVAKGHHKRQHDRPLWWTLVYHLAVKPLGGAVAVLTYLAVALLFRKCGVAMPGAP